MTFCPEQSQARLYTKRPEKKASRRSGEACGKLFTVSHISFRWKLVWNSANLACVYIFSLKMPFWWEYALGWPDFFRLSAAQCLKITEKVALNIVSEASYVYILSGQKFIENAKNGRFWRVFEKLTLAVKQCYQTNYF